MFVTVHIAVSLLVSLCVSLSLCVRSKMSWAEDHFSDCIAIVIAFKEWKNAKISGRFDLGGKVSANLQFMHFRS